MMPNGCPGPAAAGTIVVTQPARQSGGPSAFADAAPAVTNTVSSPETESKRVHFIFPGPRLIGCRHPFFKPFEEGFRDWTEIEARAEKNRSRADAAGGRFLLGEAERARSPLCEARADFRSWPLRSSPQVNLWRHIGLCPPGANKRP